MENISSSIETNHITVCLSIPMSTPLVFVYAISISDAESFFAERFVSATTNSEKEEFDRARALLKYANSCGAELVRIGRTEKKILIFLKFFDSDALNTFMRTMDSSVANAMQN